MIVKNLLAVISCGSSLPMAGEDLLNVKVTMRCNPKQRDLFPTTEYREQEGNNRKAVFYFQTEHFISAHSSVHRLQLFITFISNFQVAADVLEIKLGQLEVEKSDAKPVKKTSKKRKRPADDDLHSATASPQPCYQNDNDRDSDEILEITPEIFQPADQEDEAYAPHFLMQVDNCVRLATLVI